MNSLDLNKAGRELQETKLALRLKGTKTELKFFREEYKLSEEPPADEEVVLL